MFLKSYKEKNIFLVSMREQTQKIRLQECTHYPLDWTRSVTTVDSNMSENGGKKQNINFRKIKWGLSPVFEGNELRSSKLTLNL